MSLQCIDCPAMATHTRVAVDLDNSRGHGETAYKRVPICEAHAWEAKKSATARVEPIVAIIPGGQAVAEVAWLLEVDQ